MNARRLPHIVVFTGAGISAESGIATFRDSGALWEKYRIEDVATPEAWARHPRRVLRFYNARRRAIASARPNEAHRALVRLEAHFPVTIITQNIDDLHERAGSTQVIHIHGEITKARCPEDPDLIYAIGYRDIQWGDRCEHGHQLRPHVVWFGEPVPMYPVAASLIQGADVGIVVGTSLVVAPANFLVDLYPAHAPLYIVNKEKPNLSFLSPSRNNLHLMETTAGEGVPEVVSRLIRQYSG